MEEKIELSSSYSDEIMSALDIARRVFSMVEECGKYTVGGRGVDEMLLDAMDCQDVRVESRKVYVENIALTIDRLRELVK